MDILATRHLLGNHVAAQSDEQTHMNHTLIVNRGGLLPDPSKSKIRWGCNGYLGCAWPSSESMAVVGIGYAEFRRRPSLAFRWKVSDDVEQLHEAVAHVQLLVAVKQREARLIGGEINVHAAKAANQNNILFHPGC